MDFFYYNPPSTTGFSDFLSSFSNVAQVVIALVNIFLAYYIIKYQRNKDTESERRAVELQDQSIKLQWFKELIIQPNLDTINSFFSKLHNLKVEFEHGALSDELKEQLNNKIKLEQSNLRKSFVELLSSVDKNLGTCTKSNLDNLIDHATEVLFNPEILISSPADFDKYIGSKISESRNELFLIIYNYKGI